MDNLNDNHTTENLVEEVTSYILNKYVYTQEVANKLCDVFTKIHQSSLRLMDEE